MIVRRGPTQAQAQRFLSVNDFYNLEPGRALMASNTPTTLPPQIPVFIAQGAEDELVRPQMTAEYINRLCQPSRKVQMMVFPNVNHGFTARDAAPAAVEWMTDRFAGLGAPSDCRH